MPSEIATHPPSALDGPARIAAVEATGLFQPDAATDASFDRLARVAVRALDGAFALISLIGAERQKAIGRAGTEYTEAPTLEGICQYTVARGGPLAIGDTSADPLVRDLPPVREGGLAAYLGVPLHASGGVIVGSFAVCDTRTHEWSEDDVTTLTDLAAAISAEIDARAALREHHDRQREALSSAREQSDARFKALFDGISQLTGLLAHDGTVLEVNRTALDFAGLQRGEIIDCHIWDCDALPLPAGIAERIRDAVFRAASGEAVRYEEKVADRAGRARVLEVSLKAAPGETSLLLLEGHDVTDAVQVRRLQSAMMAGKAGTWEIHLQTGEVTAHGGTFALFGLASGEGPFDVEDFFVRFHPDDVHYARGMLEHAIETGNPFTAEYRIVPSGDEVRWIRIEGMTSVGADGGVRLIGAVADITERHREAIATAELATRLQVAIDAARLGTFEHDLASGETLYDARAREIVGLPARGPVEDVLARVHAKDRPTARHALSRLREARGETIEFEFRVGIGDDIRHIAASLRSVEDEEGEFARVIGTVLDVSEHKRAVRAIRASEERLAFALEVAGMGIWELDLATQTASRSPRHDRIFGHDDLLPEWTYETFLTYVYPEDRARVDAAFQQAVAEGGDWTFECRILRHDGATRWIAGQGRIWLMEDGTPQRMIGTVLDVTQRREAEERVRQSEARFRSTFETAAVGIAHVGLDGSWLRINTRLSEIVGYTREELLARTFQDITHPDDLGADVALYEQLLSGQIDHYQLEKRYIHRDGHIVWIHLTVAPKHDATSGEIKYTIAVVEDISDKKAAETALIALNQTLESHVEARTAELARSNAELDQFAYIASHDLRAPLRAIDSLATWIQADAHGALSPASEKHFTLLRNRVTRMEHLLDSLLAYSRAGRQDAAPEDIDTESLVHDAIALVAPPEGFAITLEGEFPTVRSSRAPLELVLRNLIGNAIKHHDRPDGHITVSAKARGSWAVFTITDDGPGIGPAYRERVFGLFQTLRPRDEVEGSGMGLAIVRKNVESQGGSIILESDGRGATFRFTWPLNPSS